MYKKILVALENGRADASLLPHVAQLAQLLASELVLIHVADGWVARNYEQLKLAESDEMRADRQYLENQAATLRAQGLQVAVHLALGNLPTEILKAAQEQRCDLICMASHGRGEVASALLGNVTQKVLAHSKVPVLVVR